MILIVACPKKLSLRLFSRYEIDTQKLLKFAIFQFSLFKICLLKLYTRYFLIHLRIYKDPLWHNFVRNKFENVFGNHLN